MNVLVSSSFKMRRIRPIANRCRHFYSFEWGTNYHRSLANHLWLYRIPNKKSAWGRKYFGLNNFKGKYRHISCKRNVR